jgi:hypothetical protein
VLFFWAYFFLLIFLILFHFLLHFLYHLSLRTFYILNSYIAIVRVEFYFFSPFYQQILGRNINTVWVRHYY